MSGQSESGTEEQREWIFTFGHRQPHFPGFVRIHGTFESARAEMTRRYGLRWSMQYESEEAAGVREYNLREIR